MGFHLKRRSRSKSFARITPFSFLGGAFAPFIFMLVSLGLIAFSSMNGDRLGGVRNTAADMFSPVLSSVSRPIQNAALFVRDISGIAQMQAENMRLRQENMRLRDWHQASLFLEAENKALKSLLNVKIDPALSYISTRVMADSGNAYVKSILLSSGSNEGIAKGQAVMANDGLIGRVVDAGDSSARVLLVTDINSRIPVIIESSGHHAILAGNNDSQPLLVHLPPQAELEEGARIITSGYGGIFPYGLPVGRVVLDQRGVRKATLYADLDRAVYVRVVDKPEDMNLKTSR